MYQESYFHSVSGYLLRPLLGDAGFGRTRHRRRTLANLAFPIDGDQFYGSAIRMCQHEPARDFVAALVLSNHDRRPECCSDGEGSGNEIG